MYLSTACIFRLLFYSCPCILYVLVFVLKDHNVISLYIYEIIQFARLDLTCIPTLIKIKRSHSQQVLLLVLYRSFKPLTDLISCSRAFFSWEAASKLTLTRVWLWARADASSWAFCTLPAWMAAARATDICWARLPGNGVWNRQGWDWVKVQK